MSTRWIYELIDPRNNEVRYVGYTANLKARYTNHINDKAVNHKRNWIFGLRQIGLKPIMNIIEECDSSIVGERERFWISEYKAKGVNLVNATDGGEGGSARGRKLSDETRRKMSASKKGIPFTPEHKLNLSIANKGTKPADNTIAASINHNAREYPSLVNIVTGEVVPSGKNIAALARKLKIDNANLWSVVTGKYHQCSNWAIKQ